MLRIAPSLLSADFGKLAEAVGEVASETDWLHVDIMDAHFVPNLTIGPPVVESLRRHTGLFFDCHLMMTSPATTCRPSGRRVPTGAPSTSRSGIRPSCWPRRRGWGCELGSP
jgi:Ribulose-phosphate 3 epimerase family